MLVGYGTEVKGYWLYDPNREKVFFSRDVKFNESEVGLKKESRVIEPLGYVELEVSADGGNSDGDEPVVQEDVERAPRRSERVRHRPNYYSEGASIAAGGMEEPTCYQEAKASPKWEKAMEAEMKSLRHNDVWELVELPDNQKVVGSKWVYK